MKYLILILFLILTITVDVFPQQKETTTYLSNLDKDLNINLKGKVKTVKIIGYEHFNFDTTEYSFDSNGIPIIIVKTETYLNCKEIYCFEHGNLVSKKSYLNNYFLAEKKLKYDNFNRIIEVSDYSKKTSSNFDSSKPIFVETYKYNDLGKQTEYTMNNMTGRIFKKYVYKYDDFGNKIEEGSCNNYQGIDSSNNCEYKALHGYKYDKKGYLVKKFDYGKWSPNNTDVYYQYDENGNEIDVKGYYITTDTILGYHYAYQYDKYGNKVLEEEKDGNYWNLDFKNYKYISYQYDNKQNLVQQEYLTLQKEVINILHFSYTYDKFGNWIKKEKYQGKTEKELKLKTVEERLIEYY